jgi:hypothetical protein
MDVDVTFPTRVDVLPFAVFASWSTTTLYCLPIAAAGNVMVPLRFGADTAVDVLTGVFCGVFVAVGVCVAAEEVGFDFLHPNDNVKIIAAKTAVTIRLFFMTSS